MVAEGGTHVVVGLEAVRHVDLEPLLLELQGRTWWRVSGDLHTWIDSSDRLTDRLTD